MSELFQSITILPLVGNPAIGQTPNCFKAKPVLLETQVVVETRSSHLHSAAFGSLFLASRTEKDDTAQLEHLGHLNTVVRLQP